MKNKLFIVILVLIMFGLQTVYFTQKIGLLSNQLSYLLDTNSIMQQQIGELQGNIQSSLEESNSRLENYEISLKDLDLANQAYVVDVSISLKEYTENTGVGIYFGTGYHELEFVENHYTGIVRLPMEESYDGNVTVLITNGSTKNTEILSDYRGVNHLFEGTLTGHLEKFPTYKDGKFNLGGAVTANVTGNEFFQYDSIYLIVTSDGQEIKRVNLLKPEEEEGEPEDENASQNQDAHEEIQVQLPDFLEQEEEFPEGDIVYHPKEDIEIPEGQEISVYFQLTSKDGYYFTYEIFRGTTAMDETQEETYQGFIKVKDFFPYIYTIYDANGGKYCM
ncbi:MAG: hypothetical protein SOZ17_02480 [Agathobacter sp.]|nr:hypothetical protein [Agathobacter sp.]